MTKTTASDPATIALLEEIGNEFADALRGKFFTVEGTPLSTVKYADKTFKKKPLIAGWEFSIAYAYVGKRGNMVVGLAPEDAQEYEYIEMEKKQLDEVFPLIGPAVAKLFGHEAEKFGYVLDLEVHKRASAAYEAAVAEQAKAEQGYTENERYGMF